MNRQFQRLRRAKVPWAIRVSFAARAYKTGHCAAPFCGNNPASSARPPGRLASMAKRGPADRHGEVASRGPYDPVVRRRAMIVSGAVLTATSRRRARRLIRRGARWGACRQQGQVETPEAIELKLYSRIAICETGLSGNPERACTLLK